MNSLQSVKTVSIKRPTAIVNNAAVATGAVDVRGFSKARFMVDLGVTDAALTVLKLRESDNADMSASSDITATVFGGAGNPALPTGTDDNSFYGFFVGLRGRKRYIDLEITVGSGATGAFVTAWCDLYGAAEHPDTAAERGLAAQAIV